MKRQRYFRSFSPKDTFKLFDMIVRPILCYGAEIWGYQYLAAIEVFIELLIDRVNDRATQKIISQADNSPKSDYFKHFKTQLNISRYRCINLPFKLKRLLANFRCSGHNLMVEKGRYQNIDRQILSKLSVTFIFILKMLRVCTLYDELGTQCFFYKLGFTVNKISNNFIQYCLLMMI